MVWTQADFELAYRLRVRQAGAPDHGQIVSYGRRFAQQFAYPHDNELTYYIERITALTGAIIGPNTSVLVVGCGYGFLLEVAVAYGSQLAKVWGVDTSAYIHANKAAEADATIVSHILNYDITSPTILNDLKPYIGGNGKFNVIVTEGVVERLTPSERQGFFNACDTLQMGVGGVAHFVSCKQPDIVEGGVSYPDEIPEGWGALNMTWQTHAEWVALRPAHYWLDESNNLAVLGGA